MCLDDVGVGQAAVQAPLPQDLMGRGMGHCDSRGAVQAPLLQDLMGGMVGRWGECAVEQNRRQPESAPLPGGDVA